MEKQGAGILTLSADNNYTGTTNIIAGTLALDTAGQIDQSAVINNNAIFEIIDGMHTVKNITGSGTTVVDTGTLTASSIYQGTLTFGIGARVTIQPIPGGPLGIGDNLSSVPEPSTLVLLGIGLISLLAYGWRRRAK